MHGRPASHMWVGAIRRVRDGPLASSAGVVWRNRSKRAAAQDGDETGLFSEVACGAAGRSRLPRRAGGRAKVKARRKPGRTTPQGGGGKGRTRSEHDPARRERGPRRISQRRGLRADGCRVCRAFAGGCFPLCATSERSSSRGALGNKRRSCAFLIALVIGTALSTCASCPSSTHIVCTRALLSVLRARIVSWPAPLDPLLSHACLLRCFSAPGLVALVRQQYGPG